jgi:hypothetical protein
VISIRMTAVETIVIKKKNFSSWVQCGFYKNTEHILCLSNFVSSTVRSFRPMQLCVLCPESCLCPRNSWYCALIYTHYALCPGQIIHFVPANSLYCALTYMHCVPCIVYILWLRNSVYCAFINRHCTLCRV